jgi:hypothetical protein
MCLESDGGMVYWQGKTEELGEKPVPVPLGPPQSPHGLTRASAVRGRRLTTWAMARPRRMLDKIFYEADRNDMLRKLLQSVLSPFLWIGMTIDSFHWWGNSSLFQISIISLCISECNIPPSPPCLNQLCWNLIRTWRFIPFQLSDSNLNLSGTRLWHKWLCCLNFSLPNTTCPLYIQQLTEVILPPSQNLLRICKIAPLIL